MSLRELTYHLQWIIVLIVLLAVLLLKTNIDSIGNGTLDPKTTNNILSLGPISVANKTIQLEFNQNRQIFLVEDPQLDTPHKTFLRPPKIPNIFYYLWCGKKSFTFQNYIAMLSVIRHMRPDVIVFYYQTWPTLDENMLYNTWFEELRHTFPFIFKLQRDNLMCGSNNKPKLEGGLVILNETGGIFITEGTIITKTLDLNTEFYFRWDPVINEGFLMAIPGLAGELNTKMLLKQPSYKCPNVTMSTEHTIFTPVVYYNTPEETMNQIQCDVCARIDGTYFPRDFWTRSDLLGKLVRKIFYGTSEIRVPMKYPRMIVPNVGHMIWIGGGEMDYLFYLSVLSVIYIQKVEVLYIHGDQPPSGKYWQKLQNIPKIVFKYRDFNNFQIYGNKFFNKNPRWQYAHYSDIARIDILVKWGGIYIDTDAIFVKKFDDELRKYDTVAHYSMARRLPYPDTFANGLMLARPGAPFMVKFQDTMRQYMDNNWLYNSLLAPYKIMERYPWLVHIDPHTEVVCLLKKCHPTWFPLFKKMEFHHLNTDSLKDWRNDANVYHFCSNSTPDELKNETALLTAPKDSMFAQMGRLILKKANRYPKKI